MFENMMDMVGKLQEIKDFWIVTLNKNIKSVTDKNEATLAEVAKQELPFYFRELSRRIGRIGEKSITYRCRPAGKCYFWHRY